MKNLKLIFVVLIAVFILSCSKDSDESGVFSIVGKWTQSIEDKSYSESEHFTLEFKGDGNVLVTVDGSLPAYQKDGPSIYTSLYSYTNDILRLWDKGYENDDWKGILLIKDNNTFEWDGIIFHRM